MNKKKIIISLLIIAAIFITALRWPNKKIQVTEEKAKQATTVKVQTASSSKTLTQKIEYPGIIAGDQDVTITSKAGGTIIIAPRNIGSRVATGSILAKIDDTSSLAPGDSGLKNLQVQQAEIAAQQAKKSYELAKNTYDDLKKSNTSTTTQKDNAKIQRDIAKLQYENAQLGLSGSIDSHLITSPISGVITNKAVSVGDSISAGQQIATVSKSSNVKVQFYVDSEQQKKLTPGQKISATDSSGLLINFVIKNISITADQATKRFLIEAYPETLESKNLLSGSIVNVSIDTIQKPISNENFILPLSSINIGQNESFILIAQNNIAKKIPVEIINVKGESAEISSTMSSETLIIIEGNKLLHDGEAVSLQN
jgi:RND family efflux transporter MFP subunit